jgi:hypothetical protein
MGYSIISTSIRTAGSGLPIALLRPHGFFEPDPDSRPSATERDLQPRRAKPCGKSRNIPQNSDGLGTLRLLEAIRIVGLEPILPSLHV